MHISPAVIAFAAACALLLPATAVAYTVGNRVFPATVPRPQAAPGDALYVTRSTRPVAGQRLHHRSAAGRVEKYLVADSERPAPPVSISGSVDHKEPQYTQLANVWIEENRRYGQR